MIPSMEPEAPGALDLDVLRQGAAAGGVDLSAAQLGQLERYAEELVAWNRRVNLTRLTSPRDIAVRHVLDSLAVLQCLPPRMRAVEAPLSCIDVGTGAGLPGLALAVVRPRWRWALADAVGKKVAFVAHVAAALDLAGATAIHRRAEDLGRDPAHRERHDLAVARAVAGLPVLAEYLLPLVRVGGLAVAMKGAEVDAELAAAEKAIAVLGGRLVDVVAYRLPDLDEPRRLVVVAKVAATPAEYPRRAGLPGRRPIGS